MIFVTVGTHEQPFDRLIREVDRLKGERVIEDKVVMQTGFSDYVPRNCEWNRLYPADIMQKNIEDARIVITHGGPASFIMPLQLGKIPVVVPRQEKYGEHVNDHQVEFVEAVAERMGTIIPVYEICKLKDVIEHYNEFVSSKPSKIKSNNETFNRTFGILVREMF